MKEQTQALEHATTGRGGDANNRVLEPARQTGRFTTAAVRDGTHLASKLCIFVGGIHLQSATPAAATRSTSSTTLLRLPVCLLKDKPLSFNSDISY
jgi:hypothetical protein